MYCCNSFPNKFTRHTRGAKEDGVWCDSGIIVKRKMGFEGVRKNLLAVFEGKGLGVLICMLFFVVGVELMARSEHQLGR